MERHGAATFELRAEQCMTREPVTVRREQLATHALDLLEARRITSLVVVDARGALDGVVHLHDLWKTEMI